jgi:methionyl-tRNA formyltransferase
MKIIIFLSHNRCNNVEEFLLFCKENFNIVKIYDKNNIYKREDYDDTVDFYISFLNPYIIKDERIIKKGCINFHPSLPKYRGVCGGSLSLYYNDKYHGVTAHYIDSKIDSGNIIEVIKFEIPSNIDCYELSVLTRKYALKLSKIILTKILKTKKIANIDKSLKWGNILMTRKKFKNWMTIDLEIITNINEIERKIKACTNNKFDGPYIKINEKLYTIKLT